MYPNHVVIEFCHKQQVWRAFDRSKIIAFNRDEDAIEALFADYEKLAKRETISPGSGHKSDLCRLHYGQFLPARRNEW